MRQGRPVVALETAVATHGLPQPDNLEALQTMEREIEGAGAVAAICLLRDGQLIIGASLEEVAMVVREPLRQKASIRDLGYGVVCGWSAGLTVSASLFAAELAGISVFATGGIGGVHLGAEETGDISADLHQLAHSRVITVAAGAKSVLDISRTLEYLETLGVPVFGYRTNTFPAFYLTSSGLPVNRVDSSQQVASIARTQWELGYGGGIVIGNPIPAGSAMHEAEWEELLAGARQALEAQGISGKDVTPFLLEQVAKESRGKTIDANLALLRHNARLAGEIAAALAA